MKLIDNRQYASEIRKGIMYLNIFSLPVDGEKFNDSTLIYSYRCTRSN